MDFEPSVPRGGTRTRNPPLDSPECRSVVHQQTKAQFTRPEFLDLQFESFSFSQHAITETLVSSQNFAFNGHRYNFSELTPGGITLYNHVSNTPLPGVAGFTFALPYAGHCVAVAGGDQNER